MLYISSKKKNENALFHLQITAVDNLINKVGQWRHELQNGHLHDHAFCHISNCYILIIRSPILNIISTWYCEEINEISGEESTWCEPFLFLQRWERTNAVLKKSTLHFISGLCCWSMCKLGVECPWDVYVR